MEFNKAYNQAEFLSFLRTSFLPEDFQQETSVVDNPIQFQYTKQVIRLGDYLQISVKKQNTSHLSAAKTDCAAFRTAG